MKKSLLVLTTLALGISLAACGKNENSNNANAGASSGAALSGAISAAGSTALQPLVDQASKKFMDLNKDVTITVNGGGSGAGLSQVAEGTVQIGNSDVFAEEKLKDADADKAKELVDHQVAVVSIAAVANKDVGVDNLTKAQLVDIFTGKVTNWKDVGGKDEKVVLVNRPASSGTRATFENFALGAKSEDLPDSITEDASGTVRKLVSETPGAIGYLALSYLDDTIQALKYEGVEPTSENVASGTYPVWAYEHMYTKGQPEGAVKAFLDYMLSDEIQTTDVKDLGYIPVSDMKVTRDVAGVVSNK
ncbi:phosphate ABC transporter substrate-binding protein PstS family protein [Cohnella sp. JJ-181]|uniref:phosphate ABC transporter substrate-binding protein PstS family protein n=1 Tax=Cohnella rhizoplanae TaxID=2974897 RepID=UPI0022FF5DDE|nr:phosphate ABC transporter substrate-binding protein PstS family protein [Cohnella sp. JJ-181]CAI6078042.1 Phosphate-binding protein PstS 1 [Cohnella sp. JJ-181]